MKLKLIITLAISLLSISCTFAQTYSTVSDNTPSSHWIALGTINLTQGGNDAYLKIYGGAGYNANSAQQGYIEVHIRTSNGSSVDANGFAFAATATAYGRGGSFISQINIVPNNGGVNATLFTIYAYWGSFPGNSFYSVEASAGSTWAAINTATATAPGGYVAPFEYFLWNNSYLMGQVGINTSDTKGYQFAVNGGIVATAVTVKLNSNWPDYVFEKNYQLPALSDLKSYLEANHHLPEMLSAGDIAKQGLNLGEMDKLLTKKVEELTLYLIEKDEKEKKQQQEIDLQEARIKKLEDLILKLTASK